MEPSNAANTVPLSLALWEPDDETRTRTVQMLARLGFQVHGCRDAAGLFHWLDLRDADLVLVGESAPLQQVLDPVLPRLSSEYGAGILVQAQGAAPQARLNALRAGAHVCLERRYEAVELGALLRAQARRATRQRRRAAATRPLGGPPNAVGLVGSTEVASLLGVNTPAILGSYAMRGDAMGMSVALATPTPAAVSPAANRAVSAADPWRVLYQGWVLVTPRGKRIHLTGTERACFACLLNNPKRELSRSAMHEFMTATNLRSVNVAISRLRRKVDEAGERLPLHTVHGMGYVFVGDLAAQEYPLQ